MKWADVELGDATGYSTDIPSESGQGDGTDSGSEQGLTSPAKAENAALEAHSSKQDMVDLIRVDFHNGGAVFARAGEWASRTLDLIAMCRHATHRAKLTADEW